MDQMDIDHVYDVPDTPPNRISSPRISGRRIVPGESNRLSSMPRPSGQQTCLVGSEEEPMVIDSGSRRHLRPQRSSSSVNGGLFRRGMSDKPNHINQNSIHARQRRSVRLPPQSFGSTSQDDSFVDLTESPHKTSFNGLPNDNPAIDGASLHGVATFLIEETGSVNGVGSGIHYTEGIDGSAQNEPGNGNFLSRGHIAPPKVNRQKRLVRNGCISPNNIAKGKQLAGMNADGSEDLAHNNCEDNAVREMVAEDNDSFSRKGKGIMTNPSASMARHLRHNNLHDRSYLSSNVMPMGPNDSITHTGNDIIESHGWRSTRNQRKGIYISSSADREQISVGEADGPRYSSQHQESRLGRKDKGPNSLDANDYPDVQNLVSPEHVHPQHFTESLLHRRVMVEQLNESHSASDSVVRRQRQKPRQRQRQRQGAASSNCAESSTPVSNDPEIVCLNSSAEASGPTYTSSWDNLHGIVEVEESTPSAEDEDARARQVEADEQLARELQEQLYNEFPVFGVGEVDAHAAPAFQLQDDSIHGVFERGLSRARMPTLPPSRSTSNAPRRGAPSRGSTSGRMTRLRSRFAGQPRGILPTRARRAPSFPAEMDLDTRIHILGALEDFSNMETSGFLPFEQAFNGNDYESLLALDENNDQHRGSSTHHINSLPQSTVMTDNFGEACAICLETPSIGDTIRHLPCLHKFHKDCIDEWLRRRTSCPICKSSIN
ncbi:uncharacterized protein LOC127242733 isoform X2 [Andrographis paniculata]|uniref:uncharacterized protein LOC127242733 isoform X2 n=1 Tax=Andrographis paniculata TaxID=175694 RepID=UPI0021E97628|nr:uncharacterized protein LOC127242733 isoform X2 [Andrographis paniculata]